MASVYRKNGRWYARYKDGAGRWRDTATACLSKQEAKGLARELEQRADRQRRGLEPLEDEAQRMTFGQLIDLWWTERGRHLKSATIKLIAENLRAPLGSLPLRDITSAKLESLLNSKLDELSPESLNHLRSFVHRVFELASRRGLWNRRNPASTVAKYKVPKRLPEYLRPSEVSQLLAALDPRWRPLFAAAVYTGLRRGELLGLRKEDIDIEAGTIAVCRSHDSDTTKGGHADLLPIADDLRPFLVAAIEASPSKLVFPAPDGRQHPRDVALQKVLRRALGRAGIVEGYEHRCRRRGCGYRIRNDNPVAGRCPRCNMQLWSVPLPRPVRFHALRHTTATLLLKAGVPLATVQRILRHSDPSITAEVYGHLDLDDMRAGINRLRIEALPEMVVEIAPETPELGGRAANLLLEDGSQKVEGPAAAGFPQKRRDLLLVGATGFEPATTCTPSISEVISGVCA